MGQPILSTVGVNVQIVGHWNPSVFVPRWFSDVGLLAEDEAEAATIQVIHEEIAAFNVEWFSLRVQRDRLVAATTRLSHSESLRDLVFGTLELLTHTPTRSMGFNHDYSFEFGDRDSFDHFGWTIVEPENWPLLERPGMATVQVQGGRTDEREGYVRVKVEPLLDGTYRVAVGVNDHYQITNEDSSRTTPELASIVQERWLESEREADAIVASLRSLAK